MFVTQMTQTLIYRRKYDTRKTIKETSQNNEVWKNPQSVEQINRYFLIIAESDLILSKK